MKKIFPIVILIMGIVCHTYANTGPVSSERQGTITFDSGSLLSKNVSVEKEVLLFKVNSINSVKKDAKYIGYDYITDLLKKKGYTDKDISNRTFNSEKDSGKVYSTMFYKLDDNTDYDYSTGSLEITVQYTLKNNSDLKIENEEVGFSSLVNEYINDSYIRGNLSLYSDMCNNNPDQLSCNKFIDNLYVFYSENKYPQNLKIYLGKSKLKVNEKYMIDDINKNYENLDNSAKNTYLVKKVSSFKISLDKNETKKLTINYTIPLQKFDYKVENGIKYDFSPIFNWKNGKVKEVDILVVGDKNNILNSSESNFNSNIPNERVNTITKIDLKNPKDNLYYAKISDVSKQQNMNALSILFNSPDDILGYNFCGIIAINSDFFCGVNGIGISDDGNGKYKAIKASSNPKNVIIDYKDGTSKEYKIFDLLK